LIKKGRTRDENPDWILLILVDFQLFIFKTKQMNTKLLVGGAIGAVVLFLLGWVFYGILLADTLAQHTNPVCMKPSGEATMGLIFLGNLTWGMALAYILSIMSGTITLQRSALTGAIVGLLFAFGYNALMYATTNLLTSFTVVIIRAAMNALLYAAAGAAIGWWLARK